MTNKKKEPISLNSFHPQAYLMYLLNISNLGDTIARSKLNPKRTPVGVHSVTGPGSARDTLTKIYNSKSSSSSRMTKGHFFNLETYKITALVPEIRFYKAEGDRYTPFYFPVATDASEASSPSGNSRLKGTGVTSFDIQYLGTDPFTAPKFLKANLSVYVDNLANVFDREPGYAPLADLFTVSIANPKKKRSKNSSTISSGDISRPIEIAATMGYVIPSSRLGIFTKEEIREIKESNIVVRMNVIHHNISIMQDGSATITIEYTARIDNAARDRLYSVVDNPIDLLKRANVKQLLAAEKVNTDDIKKGKNTDDTGSVRKKRKEKMIEIRSILDDLDRNQKIHRASASFESVSAYSLLGTDSTDQVKQSEALVNANENIVQRSPILRGVGAAASSVVSSFGEITGIGNFGSSGVFSEFTRALNDMDFSKRKVDYVLFGDLLEAFFRKHKETLESSKKLLAKANDVPANVEDLDEAFIKSLASAIGETEEVVLQLAAFSNKSDDEKKKINKTIDDAIKKMSTFKVLLADVDYKAHALYAAREDTLKINIADIPISMETYQHFMFDKINNSYDNTYTITRFLNDCVKDLLPDAFGINWSAAGIAPKVISERPSFTSTTFSGANLRKAMASKGTISPQDVPGSQKRFMSTMIRDDVDYFIISQAPDAGLISDRTGDVDKDSRDGIYHFILGKDRGLIKEMSFERYEIEGQREQLMTNQVGLYDELKIPYSANISMIGNNLFMPGSQIYINPDNIGFGSPTDVNSPAYRFGLGGYSTVLNVSTTYNGQTGEMSTELGCSFGTRAGADDSLSGLAAKIKSNVELNRAEESNDASPEDIPSLNNNLPSISRAHYMTQLQSLTDPNSGLNVLDEVAARNISNDYILHQNTNAVSVPGVIDKTMNPNTGGVRYYLERGEVIEIDDTRPSSQAVKLINGRRRR